MAKDMRSYMSELEKAEELVRISDEVDVEGEIGRRLFESTQKALLFENVKNFPNWKVLGQAPANIRHVGLAFGTEPKKVINEFASRVDKGLVKCKTVSSGPVKDLVLKESDADLLAIPSHVAAERDPGRFIASGLCIVKDPETGIRNMAFHRLQVKGAKKMGCPMVPGRHTWIIHRKYEAMNKAMPMAVVIGHHPMYYFAAAYSAPLDLDELEVAGALLEEPAELVKCETIDVEAPALAEIILECEVPPHVREEEGPYSELLGYYGPEEKVPVVNLKAITMRKDAIFKAIEMPSHTEALSYNGMTQAAALLRDLRNVTNFIDLKDVTCNWGSITNVVIQMTPRFYGEAKRVLLAAVSSYYLHQKIAIAVDEDVDIHNPQDVAWAIATRVNPETDISIVSGVRGHPNDISLPEVEKPRFETQHRISSVALIDATKPPICDPEARARFDRARPPSVK